MATTRSTTGDAWTAVASSSWSNRSSSQSPPASPAVGELLRLLEVLGGQQDRGARGREPLHGGPHLEPGRGVQAGRGLVEDDHRRVADEAHRDVQASPHAAGVRPGTPVRRVGEGEAPQQVLGDRAGVRHPPQPGDEDEVLLPGEHRVDRGELPGQADGATDVVGAGRHVEPRDRDHARVGPQQRRQDAHQGGLPGAVGAEEGDDLPPLDLEVDAAQHLEAAVGLLHAAQQDGRPGARPRDRPGEIGHGPLPSSGRPRPVRIGWDARVRG